MMFLDVLDALCYRDLCTNCASLCPSESLSRLEASSVYVCVCVCQRESACVIVFVCVCVRACVFGCACVHMGVHDGTLQRTVRDGLPVKCLPTGGCSAV